MNLRPAIIRELRSSLLLMEPAGPVPADLDAEGEILSAVIDGRVTCDYLKPLQAHHFYSELNQAVWRAACDVAPGDAAGIRAALHTAGWRGDLSNELFALWAGQPFVLLPRLREHVSRLVELWVRRELIATMRRLDRLICAGALTADEARAKFDARARELLG